MPMIHFAMEFYWIWMAAISTRPIFSISRRGWVNKFFHSQKMMWCAAQQLKMPQFFCVLYLQCKWRANEKVNNTALVATEKTKEFLMDAKQICSALSLLLSKQILYLQNGLRALADVIISSDSALLLLLCVLLWRHFHCLTISALHSNWIESLLYCVWSSFDLLCQW